MRMAADVTCRFDAPSIANKKLGQQKKYFFSRMRSNVRIIVDGNSRLADTLENFLSATERFEIERVPREQHEIRQHRDAIAATVHSLRAGADNKTHIARFARVAQDILNYGKASADAMATELWHALVAKALDRDVTRTSVPPLLDKLWHAVILETEVWDSFCVDVLGGDRLPHSQYTSEGSTSEEKNKRIDHLQGIARSIFPGRQMDESWWSVREDPGGDDTKKVKGRGRKAKRDRERVADPGLEVYFKMLEGPSKTMYVSPTDPISLLTKMVAFVDRCTEGEIRLIYAGRQLELGHSVGHYGITNQTTIHVVKRLRGC